MKTGVFKIIFHRLAVVACGIKFKNKQIVLNDCCCLFLFSFVLNGYKISINHE